LNNKEYSAFDLVAESDCPWFKEEIGISARELGTKDLIMITDGIDDDGKWVEELWDETDIGFPKRERKMYRETFNNISMCW